jgi:branched-chain amino acid transport system ATP-binding protein
LADEFILETHGLTKEFAGFFAVRDVALKVRRGSIHALIGPNGRSKTSGNRPNVPLGPCD